MSVWHDLWLEVDVEVEVEVNEDLNVNEKLEVDLALDVRRNLDLWEDRTRASNWTLIFVNESQDLMLKSKKFVQKVQLQIWCVSLANVHS